MCIPKKRRSRMAVRRRRAAFYYRKAPNVSTCPHCHEPKLPHRVCPHCGYYNGREILALEKEES